MFGWFKTPAAPRYLCKKHGEVVNPIRVFDCGSADGLYCSKCYAEFLASTLCKVTIEARK